MCGLAPLQMACTSLHKYFRLFGHSIVIDQELSNKHSVLSGLIRKITTFIDCLGPSLDIEHELTSNMEHNIIVISIILRILQTYTWSGLFEKFFKVITTRFVNLDPACSSKYPQNPNHILKILSCCLQSFNHIIKHNTVKFIFAIHIQYMNELVKMKNQGIIDITIYDRNNKAIEFGDQSESNNKSYLTDTYIQLIKGIFSTNTVVTKKISKYIFAKYLKNDKKNIREIIFMYIYNINSYSLLKYWYNLLSYEDQIVFIHQFMNKNKSHDQRLFIYLLRRIPYWTFKSIVNSDDFIIEVLIRVNPSPVYDMFKSYSECYNYINYCQMILGSCFSDTTDADKFFEYTTHYLH